MFVGHPFNLMTAVSKYRRQSVYTFDCCHFIVVFSGPLSFHRSGNQTNSYTSTTYIPDMTRQLRDQGNRKHVVRMLVVIVLQYFICWTPIYLLNTWQAFDFRAVLHYISPTVKSLLLLLAYTSSFIHPITYCFMNRSFKEGFARSFRGCSAKSRNQSALRMNVTSA